MAMTCTVGYNIRPLILGQKAPIAPDDDQYTNDDTAKSNA